MAQLWITSSTWKSCPGILAQNEIILFCIGNLCVHAYMYIINMSSGLDCLCVRAEPCMGQIFALQGLYIFDVSSEAVEMSWNVSLGESLVCESCHSTVSLGALRESVVWFLSQLGPNQLVFIGCETHLCLHHLGTALGGCIWWKGAWGSGDLSPLIII